MVDRNPPLIGKFDLLWMAFLAGLALLTPVFEIHKQLVLLAFGTFQFLESRLLTYLPKQGPSLSVLIKIALATLLMEHTGELGINSNYYPVYYLPIVTAAVYFTPIFTLLWTAFASLAYCSFLIPALRDYDLSPSGASRLGIRILFFFLAGVLVNRFAMENRSQIQRLRELSETLSEANRQLQRAEAEGRRVERLAALGQLSAGLAHEIRNPLGIIKGSAEMLRKKLQSSDPVTGELAGYISSEVNRASSLVARFLDFARPSRLDLKLESISDILDRAFESVHHQFVDSPITVKRSDAADLPRVLVDRQLCEQVFVNLMVNAFEAMTEHGGMLSLSVAREVSNGNPGVLVNIDDTGPGIFPELHGQIFNPFYTSKKEGVGLGLSIAAKIVDDHRGWIRLVSEPPQGAHFRVFLPENPEG